MSVRFYTDRSFPSDLKHLGAYGSDAGDFMQGAAAFVRAASPWDFLTGVFVDKPRAEAEAQVAQAQAAASAIAAQQAARQQTLRTVMIVGAGLVGVLVLVVATRPRAPKVAGYRRKKARR